HTGSTPLSRLSTFPRREQRRSMEPSTSGCLQRFQFLLSIRYFLTLYFGTKPCSNPPRLFLAAFPKLPFAIAATSARITGFDVVPVIVIGTLAFAAVCSAPPASPPRACAAVSTTAPAAPEPLSFA